MLQNPTLKEKKLDFEQALKKAKDGTKEFRSFIKELNYYNNSSFEKIESHKKKISMALNNLNLEYSKLASDVNLLKKHIPAVYRFRIFLNMLLEKS